MARKLAAILSADVKGYSRLMGEDEAATVRTLTAHRALMTSLIQQHKGRVVDSPGDNLLAEFASVVDAVQCAVEIQRELKARNVEVPESRKMEFRIGINLGDVIVEDGRLYGDGVNIAARLESLADAGGICISSKVFEEVENKLALSYEYVGEQTVKNIAKSIRVYRVRLEPGTMAPTGGHEQTSALPLPDKPSIAVLPFANMSGDAEQEYFSDGITEDLITDLSKLSGLFVIARHSVFTYKGKAAKVQEVGREFGVRYVLEGSVRKANNRVRITAQLVDATTGHHLWAERYDRDLQDIFALQDELVQKIVTTLKLQVAVWEQGIAVRKHTDSVEAYDALLRGLAYLYRFTPEAIVQARQIWERAVELDPQYADAYAGLGWAYYLEWNLQWSPDPHALEQAFALAQQAVAFDESLPEPHKLLSYVYLFKKQHDRALAEAERAIALDPNDAESYMGLADVLSFAGRPEEALGLLAQAMRLNPRYPLLYSIALARVYHLTGQSGEAIATLKRTLSRSPDALGAHLTLAALYSEGGQEAEARMEAAEVLRLNPHWSLEVWRQRAPYRDAAVLERFLAALRKAGLK
jgi:adenylate cyclase